ncbi:hypothetical protein [Nocardiopsis sp. NRRL B-16309]|uniref:hypothetical protein n=1 Tax=Nocardiopsis sp. NRRL B-16309 TaxID=1519494 RepID=UPI0006AEE656|nr:hypothetical protein [Nocardiopsis sp. NRRL B-16309]KOX13697.1 hypothetical protein ADL05_18640 [Nocardiopsis sp. NRRL B-16309]
MTVYQLHLLTRHHWTEIRHVGAEQDRLREPWFCLGDEDMIRTVQVEGPDPRTATRTFITDDAPMPPITYEAEGLIPVPPLDRVQASGLCGTVEGAEGHEDGCLLYCAVAHDGTIVDQGTYDHVQPRLSEATTLMAVSSRDPGDPSAPLNAVWVPRRMHIPGVTGPITGLVNALETATGFPYLMFDRYALLAYRDALAAYNPTAFYAERVMLTLQVWDETTGYVAKNIADATAEDLTGCGHSVSWPGAARIGKEEFVGPIFTDEVLYLLPAPPHSGGWRFYDPCGVCAGLDHRHPACRLCA